MMLPAHETATAGPVRTAWHPLRLLDELFISGLGLPAAFAPRWAGRHWLRLSLPTAVVVALLNLALIVPWYYLLLECKNRWRPELLPPELAISDGNTLATVLGVVLGGVIMYFFLLLALAPRPGSTAACLRHVARTTLLGTGLLHLWAAAFAGTFLVFAQWNLATEFYEYGALFLALLSILTLATLLQLGRAVTLEYRQPEDYPPAADPLCDACGYELRATDPASRCPECGKPVLESIGPDVRPTPAWETRPRFYRVGEVLEQAQALVRHPRQLFSTMPARTGQAAARHWMIGWILLTGLAAAALIPLSRWVSYSGSLFPLSHWTSWCFMLSLGTLWALFGMMMIGIETGGVTIVAWWHGHRADMGAVAKVTNYAAPLMLFWVLLGGLHIYAWAVIYDRLWWRRWGDYKTQIFFTVSLALAHIGGLLWYELTVYRGLRGIQWANR